jgi:hypothetical protein
LDRHLRVNEDKLTNNKPSLSILQHNLNVACHSDRKLSISEPNLPNKDIWLTVERCTNELGKIMSLESLNLSLTLLNENGLRIRSSQGVEKVSTALLCAINLTRLCNISLTVVLGLGLADRVLTILRLVGIGENLIPKETRRLEKRRGFLDNLKSP